MRFFVLLVCLALCSQEASATWLGVIKDPSGKVIRRNEGNIYGMQFSNFGNYQYVTFEVNDTNPVINISSCFNAYFLTYTFPTYYYPERTSNGFRFRVSSNLNCNLCFESIDGCTHPTFNSGCVNFNVGFDRGSCDKSEIGDKNNDETFAFTLPNSSILGRNLQWTYIPQWTQQTCSCKQWNVFVAGDKDSVYQGNVAGNSPCFPEAIPGNQTVMTWIPESWNTLDEWKWFGVIQEDSQGHLSKRIEPRSFCLLSQKRDVANFYKGVNDPFIKFDKYFTAQLDWDEKIVPVIDTRCDRNAGAKIRCIRIDTEEILAEFETTVERPIVEMDNTGSFEFYCYAYHMDPTPDSEFSKTNLTSNSFTCGSGNGNLGILNNVKVRSALGSVVASWSYSFPYGGISCVKNGQSRKLYQNEFYFLVSLEVKNRNNNQVVQSETNLVAAITDTSMSIPLKISGFNVRNIDLYLTVTLAWKPLNATVIRKTAKDEGCSATGPVISNLPDSYSIGLDNDGTLHSEDLAVSWKGISNWGTLCPGQTYNNRLSYSFDTTIDETLETSAESVTVTVSKTGNIPFTLTASNGYQNTIKESMVKVCENTCPNKPVVTTSNLVLEQNVNKGTVSWTGNLWDNCAGDSKKESEFYYTIEENGQVTSFHTTQNSVPVTLSNIGANGEGSFSFSVRSCRVVDNSPTFCSQEEKIEKVSVCRKTKPSSPKNVVVTPETGTGIKFTWVQPDFTGNKCSDSCDLEYRVRLYKKGFDQTYSATSSPFTFETQSVDVTYEYSVYAVLCGMESDHIKGTTHIGACSQIPPSVSTDKVSPANDTSLDVANGDEVTITWPSVSWGALCESSTQTASQSITLYITDPNGATTPKVLGSESTSFSFTPSKSGVYSWKLNLVNQIQQTTIPGAEVDHYEIEYNGHFHVDVYQPGHLIIKCDSEHNKYIRFENNFNVNLDSSSVYDSTLNPTCTATLQKSGKTLIDLGESTSAPSGGSVPFNWPTTDLEDGTYHLVLTTTTKGSTKTSECDVDICTPEKPDQPYLSSEVVNSNYDGDIELSWDTPIDHSCGASPSSMKYHLTITGSDLKTPETHVFALDVNSFSRVFQSGEYQADLVFFNGYSNSSAATITFSSCKKVDFDAPTLLSPENNAVRSNSKISFSFSKIEAVTNCAIQRNYFVLKNETKDVVLFESIETGVSFFTFETALEDNAKYSWQIIINAYGVNSTSEERFFTAKQITGTINSVGLESPAIDETLLPISGVVEFRWNVSASVEMENIQSTTTLILLEPADDGGIIKKRHIPAPERSESMNLVLTKGGVYSWQITVSSSDIVDPKTNGDLTVLSSTRSFSFCRDAQPRIAPIPSGDTKYIYRPDGGKIEFTYVDPYDRCGDFRSFYLPSHFDVTVENLFKSGDKHIFKMSTNRTEIDEDNDGVIEFSDFGNISLGKYVWSVSVTNIANFSKSSNPISLIFCGPPSTPELSSPDMSSNVTVSTPFVWKVNNRNDITVDMGYSCVDGGHQFVTVSFALVEEGQSFEEAAMNPVASVTAEYTAGGVKATEMLKKFEVNRTYVWFVTYDNGDGKTERSELRAFNTTSYLDCAWRTNCSVNHGRCVRPNESCACPSNRTGYDCEIIVDETKDNTLYFILAGVGALLLIILIIILAVVISRRKKNSRKKVVLKAPGGDLRFVFVTKPSTPVSDKNRKTVKEAIISDAKENDYSWSLDVASASKGSNTENITMALLYAHQHFNNDSTSLLKVLISKEISECTSGPDLFKGNSPATLMFKHYSRMISSEYIFNVLRKPLQDVVQKDIDDAAIKKHIEDTNEVGMMVLNDTCEVDKSKLDAEESGDDDGIDQLVTVNSLQLQLTTQRILRAIYRSANMIPSRLREIMQYLSVEVNNRYPEELFRVRGCFFLLRLFYPAIVLPESFDLISDSPSVSVRRTLTLIGKIIVALATNTEFGARDSSLEQFNSVIEENKKPLEKFYASAFDKETVTPSAPDDIKVPSSLVDDSVDVLAATITTEEA